ncbi:transporter substrate-binding domain-containing protein [Simiduia litorea]|uniref:substrate-binding periplasmic protein n=1 Tax=Simiduia litorea TaxID=1435348 RepID=UPI0036F1DF11
MQARLAKYATILCLTILWSAPLFAVELDELEYITENYPPFNYVEGGVLRGEAVELLIAATALAGHPIIAKNIQVQPWARAFHNTLEGNNRVLFSTTRTAERENLFQWVGPIGQNHVVLIAKRSRGIKLKSLDGLDRFKVGAVRDDVGELFLRELHLEKTIITLGVQPDSIAKMLESGRIDLWAYGESSALQTLKSIGANPRDYEVARVLRTLDLYYAFNRDIEPRLVKQLQAAIDTIKGDEANKMKEFKSRNSQLYVQPVEKDVQP